MTLQWGEWRGDLGGHLTLRRPSWIPNSIPTIRRGGAPVKLLRDRQVGPFMPSATSGLGDR